MLGLAEVARYGAELAAAKEAGALHDWSGALRLVSGDVAVRLWKDPKRKRKVVTD